ncbi:MAG: class I SAM-dependent methyltransferase [Clostridiales Family XIII bacterium]|nr:class I SAM-dependent methyltransferase [Clostridiales Family XIII bacterium]
MRAKKLPVRLAAMAGFVGAGESLADIGADHGYLPIHLVREGRSPFAILTDANPGPLEKTRASVAAAIGPAANGMDAPRISIRLGDGLAPVGAAEVDTVVIAGMGGKTIAAILAADLAKTRSFKKFVLQPRTKAGVLKTWLENAGFEILAKTAAEERGRLCDIVVCAPKGVK